MTLRSMLITGAAQRIGRHLALEFAGRGWAIGIHYNTSGGPARDLVAEIKTNGGRAAAFGADLSRPGEVAQLIPACATELGPLSCLINNASTFNHDDIGSLTGEGWDKHLDVNLKAPVFLAQAFAAQFGKDTTTAGSDKHQSDGAPAATGNVINIIDQRVLNLNPDFFSYTISKAGLWTATQTLAQALAPSVRVNAIAPGPVLKSVHQTPAQFETERRKTPLKRGSTALEIAQTIAFILDAPAMTGQMIALDGGQHLAWSRH